MTFHHQVLAELRRRKWTLGFAESCTGGLLSGSFARIAGVSDTFMGSIVSYSNDVKIEQLGVSPESLKSVGAVSEEVAREMARGICSRLKVSCSVAVTGIAGPSGGSVEKPVGTVWFAVKGPTFEAAEKRIFVGDRAAVQDQSVDFAVELLLRELKKSSQE